MVKLLVISFITKLYAHINILSFIFLEVLILESSILQVETPLGMILEKTKFSK